MWRCFDGCKCARLTAARVVALKVTMRCARNSATHNLNPAFFSSALEALAGIQALALELLGLDFIIHTWKSR